MVCSFHLKEQDGMGYLVGDAHYRHYRLNLLPPRSYPHPWFVMERDHMHPTLWLVFIDGDQIAAAPSPEEAERAVRDWAAGEAEDGQELPGG